MTRSQLTVFFIFTALVANHAHANGYKGMSVGIDNLQELTHTGDDPYVEKNNITLSGILGYQKQGKINLNYQGDVTLGVGTHRSGTPTNPVKRTKSNATIATNHRLTLSKRFGNVEPEAGVATSMSWAYINGRKHFKIDGVVGAAYHLDPRTKIGLRYQKSHRNDFIYRKFTVAQPDSQTVTAYVQKTKGKHIDSISLGYQQSKESEPTYHGQGYTYEPDNRQVMLSFTRTY